MENYKCKYKLCDSRGWIVDGNNGEKEKGEMTTWKKQEEDYGELFIYFFYNNINWMVPVVLNKWTTFANHWLFFLSLFLFLAVAAAVKRYTNTQA